MYYNRANRRHHHSASGVKPAPTYGTSQDQARLDQLFFFMIAAAIPIAAGECIFIYKLNIDRSSVGRIKFSHDKKLHSEKTGGLNGSMQHLLNVFP
jgi:hypothetical protein